MAQQQQKLETADDARSLPNLYAREIAAARKELEKFWIQGDKVVRRYLDKRDGANDGVTWFNLFWSNTNILKASLYAKQPKADVSRRHKDPMDDVGRVAGEMVERILNLDMDNQTSDVDVALRYAIEDRLLPGLGQVWMRYDPTFVKQQNPEYVEGMEPLDGVEMDAEVEVIGDEHVATDYVHWRDFLWSPARTWREVRWVARGIYMTRSELKEKFGDEIGALVPLNASKAGKGEQASLSPNDPWSKALVWEIWKKESRTVCWYVEGFDKLLGEAPDPLGLADFFPCPMPLIANNTTSAFVPKADYEMLRDQYVELDIVSARIALLEDAIRVIGVYDKSVGELKQMLDGGRTNVMVPADNWAMFAEKGGLKASVDWFPIDMVVECLNRLRDVKAAIMHDLYELTGLSDIMRGSTQASETLGAQQLKAQYGSVRMQFLQGSLAAFVQQALAIKAEIMCAHFQPETLKRKSLIEFTPDSALADQAIARLKDKIMAAYSLQVDPDTMALADYAQEQEQRIACITAIGQFMQAAMPLVQMKPEATPFLLQVLQWLLASFKAGKQIEGVLDQAIRAIAQTGMAPDPNQQAMQQAQLAKVQSEGEKNKSAAVKNIADARAKQTDSLIGVADTVLGAQRDGADRGERQMDRAQDGAKFGAEMQARAGETQQRAQAAQLRQASQPRTGA